MRPILAALLILGPATAFADTPPTAAPKEKKICRSEAETGSYFVKRTCHTTSEWAAIAAMDEKNTANFHNRRPTNLPTSLF